MAGENGNGDSGGSSYVPVALTDDIRQLTTEVRGLRLSIVNLTNAVNRFTLSTATTNRDRTQVDKQILDELAEIRTIQAKLVGR